MLSIDKQMYHLTTINITIDVSETVPGQEKETNIKQQTKLNFSDYNKIDKIKVPEKILKQ